MMSKEVKFAAVDPRLMKRLYDRASSLYQWPLDRLTFAMDISAADGVNGNAKLDYELLLSASDATFAHDVFGIIRHMNRDTGVIEGLFVPRCIDRLASTAA